MLCIKETVGHKRTCSGSLYLFDEEYKEINSYFSFNNKQLNKTCYKYFIIKNLRNIFFFSYLWMVFEVISTLAVIICKEKVTSMWRVQHEAINRGNEKLFFNLITNNQVKLVINPKNILKYGKYI